ncbi:MAG: ATP-dependent sacrificial sulfur transferase LarE [Dorea sp.]|nr:ATP-dependent sacrificial sulfur transferase LarE [Dorea sp.]
MKEKLEELKRILSSYGRVAVAFSSGVDSAFLLAVAKEVLGENVLAVTATSNAFPKRESREALEFCQDYQIRQLFVEFHESETPGFAENPKNRCYICKRQLFTSMKEAVSKEGFEVLAEGTNVDDHGDYRPGIQAIRELGILSPLKLAGLTKAEIRALSKEMGLPTWEKPSYACLASRFVYGETITKEKLAMVEAAEELLLAMGFRQMRVRIHGNLARIEVEPCDFTRVMEEENRIRIHREFKQLGFAYVALDLQGFRSGSMNETLKLN